MRYVICEKCKVKRNAEEAPNCIICTDIYMGRLKLLDEPKADYPGGKKTRIRKNRTGVPSKE